MTTTIKLFNIEAEVPEGHEDFRGEFFWCHVLSCGPFTHVWRYISLTDIFASDSMTSLYWQRRVCDAAIAHFWRIAHDHRSIDSDLNAIHEAENWRRIGEAAEKVAKGGGE